MQIGNATPPRRFDHMSRPPIVHKQIDDTSVITECQQAVSFTLILLVLGCVFED
jgi:hypothetical protein